ncbi:hypothetical protein OUZ56_018943 [Daphnia magna]|uniref:SAM domain-containing protein n=1 Tax=Daphnia magna TaxID=35525 RepID=A0ABQ9ZA94_9CRUS|nr:hypothetical protein OUZ56_018943 [Daphnia magna]
MAVKTEFKILSLREDLALVPFGNLPDYEPLWILQNFKESDATSEDIDEECLLSLTEKQIDGLGLSIGHSITLQKLVKNLIVDNTSARKNDNSSIYKDIDDVTYVDENLNGSQADPLTKSDVYCTDS